MDIKSGLGHEIVRNKELLNVYIQIGNPGVFAATMIQGDIVRAEKAMADEDVVEIVKCFAMLKENKE